MPENPVKALLFDMGGVVLDVDFEKVLAQWATHSLLTLDEIRERFSLDEPYQQHERGQISGETYFDHLRSHLQLTGSNDDIEKGWNAIFGNELTEALDAIDTVRERYRCFGFTNTNTIHQQYWERCFPRIRRSFDKLFVSSEIGLRKPDADAFSYIFEDISVTPEQVLFFDDSRENINGARRLGVQCVLVDSPTVVPDTLLNLT